MRYSNHEEESKAWKIVLAILALAAFVIAINAAVTFLSRLGPVADTSPAQSWNAEEQCQMYRHWCYTWPNCGPCVDGKPVVIHGYLEAELAKPANSRKF